MSKHDTSLSHTAPSDRAIRQDGWTLSKQAAFLRQLSATHSVTDAAKSVSMSRQSAYRLRSRLKGQAFDLAWEVAFHHSYDVLPHAALDRALNGIEMPVFFQGEQIGSYRKYDERLTVALLGKLSLGGNPVVGRLGPSAEKHARDFEALLQRLENGEAVKTGALSPDDAGELETILSKTHMSRITPYEEEEDDDYEEEEEEFPCPSDMSDEELMAALQEAKQEQQK